VSRWWVKPNAVGGWDVQLDGAPEHAARTSSRSEAERVAQQLVAQQGGGEILVVDFRGEILATVGSVTTEPPQMPQPEPPIKRPAARGAGAVPMPRPANAEEPQGPSASWITPGRVMGWIWAVVGVVVVIVNRIQTPKDAFINMFLGGGNEDVVWFVAGFTLPLTAATAVITLLFMWEKFRSLHPYIMAGIAAVILVLASGLSYNLGLGLPPAVVGPTYSGPYGPLLTIMARYFLAYGWALSLSSVLIGIAIAFQIPVLLLRAGELMGKEN
jgi:hypothetical protein